MSDLKLEDGTGGERLEDDSGVLQVEGDVPIAGDLELEDGSGRIEREDLGGSLQLEAGPAALMVAFASAPPLAWNTARRKARQAWVGSGAGSELLPAIGHYRAVECPTAAPSAYFVANAAEVLD